MARSSGEQPEMVVLELPKEAGATSVAVAGDFNGWSVQTHEMRRRDDGGFAISLELDPGRTYCYRYWVDNERWENDWSADAYVPNEYGGDNSLLDLRDGSPRRQHKTPVAHEPPAVTDGSNDDAPTRAKPAKVTKATKATKAAKTTNAAKTPKAAAAGPGTNGSANTPRPRKAAAASEHATPSGTRAARPAPAEPTS